MSGAKMMEQDVRRYLRVYPEYLRRIGRPNTMRPMLPMPWVTVCAVMVAAFLAGCLLSAILIVFG